MQREAYRWMRRVTNRVRRTLTPDPASNPTALDNVHKRIRDLWTIRRGSQPVHHLLVHVPNIIAPEVVISAWSEGSLSIHP